MWPIERDQPGPFNGISREDSTDGDRTVHTIRALRALRLDRSGSIDRASGPRFPAPLKPIRRTDRASG